VGRKSSIKLLDDPNMPKLEDISIFKDSNEDVFGAEAELNNLESTFQAVPSLCFIQGLCGVPDGCEECFLYEKIDEEVYVCQPLGFEDPDYPNKVYKVEKALYGLHQAPRIGYQVNPKVSHLHAEKRIFRYLKGQPKLGLWYPKDSLFDLMAYTVSDYAEASLDRTFTTKGCQFLGCRLISWQCKKQTVVANSITKAEYVAASSCRGQVLWIQNQLLDYGFIQTFLDKQLNGLPTHKEKYDVSFHTKKVFANMKRIGKGFSGKETPLFLTMVGPNQVQMSEGLAQPTDTQHTPNFDMPPPKPKKTQKPRQPKRKTTKVPQPSESIDIAADEAFHKEG
nr:putative ribonuclease H-like domain-containing protein [Tanacetum cinerariifolium]